MTDDADARCICAVNDACRQLNERLAPYKQSMKGATFEEIVRTAHMDRIDLSAHGWYITPDITGEDCSWKFPFLKYPYVLEAPSLLDQSLWGLACLVVF